jgi:hypothetical protein
MEEYDFTRQPSGRTVIPRRRNILVKGMVGTRVRVRKTEK